MVQLLCYPFLLIYLFSLFFPNVDFNKQKNKHKSLKVYQVSAMSKKKKKKERKIEGGG